VNRAPVLTLWAAVVAEILGFEHDEALTLGRAVAGLNAYSKGVSLGLFQPTPREVKGLAEKSYALYEKFRPEIPPGKKGRGPPASWTWTSSARWLSPDPKERLSCPILDATNRVEYGGRISASPASDWRQPSWKTEDYELKVGMTICISREPLNRPVVGCAG
jgi:hypothetical protein